MAETARRVVVSGDVQGVFFRDSCRRAALSENVRGWVRNRGDGTVEAYFEGTEVAVDAMCDWCRHGPPQAEVAHLEVTASAPTAAIGFEVR